MIDQPIDPPEDVYEMPEQSYDDARQAEIDDQRLYKITAKVAPMSLSTRIEALLAADQFDVDEAIYVLRDCLARIKYEDMAIERMIRKAGRAL